MWASLDGTPTTIGTRISRPQLECLSDRLAFRRQLRLHVSIARRTGGCCLSNTRRKNPGYEVVLHFCGDWRADEQRDNAAESPFGLGGHRTVNAGTKGATDAGRDDPAWLKSTSGDSVDWCPRRYMRRGAGNGKAGVAECRYLVRPMHKVAL